MNPSEVRPRLYSRPASHTTHFCVRCGAPLLVQTQEARRRESSRLLRLGEWLWRNMGIIFLVGLAVGLVAFIAGGFVWVKVR